MLVVEAVHANATPRQAVLCALAARGGECFPDEAFVVERGDDGARVVPHDACDSHMGLGTQLAVYTHTAGACPAAPIEIAEGDGNREPGQRRPPPKHADCGPGCLTFASRFLGRRDPFDCPRCGATGVAACAYRALWRCKKPHFVCSSCADELSPFPPMRVVCHECGALPLSFMVTFARPPRPPTERERLVMAQSPDAAIGELVAVPLQHSDCSAIYPHVQYFCRLCQRRRAHSNEPGKPLEPPDFRCCCTGMLPGPGGYVRVGDTVYADPDCLPPVPDRGRRKQGQSAKRKRE